ncbi:hypothetical protein N7457_007192 [Penicillium paradoxum]|uniref:uncharacterized protein n=1 Tax=Penicillium paradoxum TaxID=176176 RepID=UPI00254763C5|nr:uncharacterized protein N7457_007192 [Penicillium paradoxum]KAJ5779472.1 hypothetical protein N7457_007192 [Penicillium paradoxum]
MHQKRDEQVVDDKDRRVSTQTTKINDGRIARTSRSSDEKGVASIGGSVSPMTLCNKACASTGAKSRGPKIGIIKVFPRRKLSEIKLKRTDTTLDLSQ